MVIPFHSNMFFCALLGWQFWENSMKIPQRRQHKQNKKRQSNHTIFKFSSPTNYRSFNRAKTATPLPASPPKENKQRQPPTKPTPIEISQLRNDNFLIPRLSTACRFLLVLGGPRANQRTNQQHLLTRTASGRKRCGNS